MNGHRVLGCATLSIVSVTLFVLGLGAVCVSLHAAADTGIRYIDFDSGNDSNPGTRDAPWKHHPWDGNARAKSVSARGVRTYIFKKGVTYRGNLEASESGTENIPIRLTTEAGWGEGPAVLSGATAYSDGWQRCPENVALSLPHVSRKKVWCRPVKLSDEPRLLWKVDGPEVTRIPIARTPNWTSVDPDDPRSEWYELDDVIVELAVEVDQSRGFKVGESVSVAPQRRTAGSQSSMKVVENKGEQIRLEVTNWKKDLLHPGDLLSSDKSSARIKKIGGTHSIIRHLVDRKNLAAADGGAHRGATIWAERRSMPKADAAIVSDFDPERRSLQTNFHRPAGAGPRPHDRYFMEGLPAYLDSDGEYVVLSSGKRSGMLVIRLPEDRNPNEATIEAATRAVLLKIQNQSHIEVSGLSFRFGNQIAPGDVRSRHASMHASAIQITGDVTDIRVHNCSFSWLAAGVVAFPEDRRSASEIDGITITNSTFRDIDGSAIALGNGQSHYKLKKNGSRLIHVGLRNNRLNNVGYRTLPHFDLGSHGDGINVLGGEVVEVSGNRIDRSWGSGVSVTLGSDFKRGQVARPFLRGLIHHNRIVDSLLGAQDGGGITAWMGGPVYIYNNISGNPVGCVYSRHKTITRRNWYRRGCYGVGIYLDSQYKGYVFNNIVWGKSNDANDRFYNSAALNEAMGFMHTVFNNTFYRFSTGLHKGMHQHNRNSYLANLFIDMGLSYIDHEPKDGTIDHATLGYSRNQFYGKTARFGKLGTRPSDTYRDLDSWRDAMRNHKLMRFDTGTMITDQPVKDADGHDFMPLEGSPTIDAGVRVFVPWALYGVVGEWHFLRRNDDPSIINGENINMNSEWIQRDMFDRITRHDLRCADTGISDFETGILEDWIPGALRFNGHTRFCTLREAGASRVATDMGTNNFLIEMVVAPEMGATNVGLVEKRADRGYSLGLDAAGRARFILDYGTDSSQRRSMAPINDDQWHHILVDVDRANDEGITIYVDGEQASGEWSGSQMATSSIANSADLVVGRSDEGLFAGRLDFLRIARGSLSQAETAIRQVYEWEFDGPFLRDFQGRQSNGTRDVGALEYQPE